jgi:hypothetical protein
MRRGVKVTGGQIDKAGLLQIGESGYPDARVFALDGIADQVRATSIGSFFRMRIPITGAVCRF